MRVIETGRDSTKEAFIRVAEAMYGGTLSIEDEKNKPKMFVSVFEDEVKRLARGTQRTNCFVRVIKADRDTRNEVYI